MRDAAHFAQAIREVENDLPVTDMMAKLKTAGDTAKLSIGFIDFVVAPLWRTAALIFPAAKSRVEELELNRAEWATINSAP